MTISVISCGPSGEHWDGKGYSIGVNDCEKFGKPVNRLIVVNDNFEPHREVFIRKSRAPDGFFSQLDYWKDHPNFKDIGVMKHFNNRIDPGVLYHATTSPFIAISMAFNMGAKEIVLWGVDFEKHAIVNGDKLEREIDTYLRFIECLRFRNCRVTLGHQSGVFAGKLQ